MDLPLTDVLVCLYAQRRLTFGLCATLHVNHVTVINTLNGDRLCVWVLPHYDGTPVYLGNAFIVRLCMFRSRVGSLMNVFFV